MKWSAMKPCWSFWGWMFIPEPGVCYQHWHERISPAYESQVVECVERIVSNHYAEVRYPWEHPVLGRIHIRCGGRLVGNHGNWFEIMGYHQDISEIQTMREQLAQSLSQWTRPTTTR